MNEDDAQVTKKRNLIDLISREIDQFAIEQKKHGWTSRALLVALATLFWLFINQAPFTSATLQNVGFLFFSLALTIDLISSCSSMLSAQHGNLPKEPRFILSSIFGVARLSLMIRLILYTILFYISLKLNVHIFPISRILVQILLGLNVAVYLIFLIISYCNIPMPISRFQKKRGLAFASFLLTVLMIISLIGYYVALINNFNSFSPIDLKVALILTLLACVFVLMADMPATSPISSSLISIRRDLVLDKINTDWATRQIDIALSGMQVGDLLQENIKEILDQYDAINNILKQTTEDSKAIESLVPLATSKISLDELKNISRATGALFDKKDKQGEDLVAVQKKLSESVKKYQAKAKQIIAFDKRASKAIDEVCIKIEKAGEETRSWFKVDEEARAKIKVKIEKLQNIAEDPLQLPPSI